MFSQKSQLNHANELHNDVGGSERVCMILGHNDLKPQGETDSVEPEAGNPSDLLINREINNIAT